VTSTGSVTSIDHTWYLDVNSFMRSTGWAHGFMAAWALWGGLTLLAVMAIGAWLWARRERWLKGVVLAVLAGLSGVIALGINHFVSQAVGRVRPCHALKASHPALTTILACHNDYGFPSDHAVIAGAIATGLVIYNRRFGLLAWIVALFLAFGRVYAGVHYPGDVIAGLVLGAVIAVVVWALLRQPAEIIALRLTRTPLRPLVAAAAPAPTGVLRRSSLR
jgi:membrane-associated phospholipid phosphatase